MGTATGLVGSSFLGSLGRLRWSAVLGGVELADGDDGWSVESGRDWAFRLDMVEPWAWTTEASGEAADLCWCCMGIRFFGSLLEARGESWVEVDAEAEAEAEPDAEVDVVGVFAFEVEGLLPMVDD